MKWHLFSSRYRFSLHGIPNRSNDSQARTKIKFRVKFKIPPSAATGEYTIKSYLIKNGKVMQTQEKKLVVDQVGLNAFVRSSAHDYSFIYAMICIIFGVTSGWFVSVLKVKP